jgi:hypothetical protein
MAHTQPDRPYLLRPLLASNECYILTLPDEYGDIDSRMDVDHFEAISAPLLTRVTAGKVRSKASIPSGAVQLIRL